MGKRFLRQIALANEDVPASTTRQPFDLPVNPLSLILLRFQITNVAPAALDTYSAFDDLVTQITDVVVRHNGEQIIQGSLRDLMVLNWAVFGLPPGWTMLSNTDNAVRSFVFPLSLGRKPFDEKSCFPATQRGNLQMFFTAGADGAGYDDVNVSVETVELIEAQPEEYVKYTTRSAVSVAGQFDSRLPIGNDLLGVLLFDTGLGGSVDEVLSWGQIKVMKDNVEQMYAACDYEVLAAELNRRLWAVGPGPSHTHQFNGAAAGLDESDEGGSAVSLGSQGYALLDFDPTKDGTFQFETAGASDLIIRAVGDEATAVRWLPIEVVKVGK